MLKSEIINKHHDKIKDAMIDAYRSVIESDGQIQYGIYIWEDGEIETLEEFCGSHAYLKALDEEPRELFYVTTISVPCCNVFDLSGAYKIPDDEDERDALKQGCVDWLVDEYRTNGAEEDLDAVLRDIYFEEV